jgi:hypothetical protein
MRPRPLCPAPLVSLALPVKTGKALGITIPRAVLLRADRVVE